MRAAVLSALLPALLTPTLFAQTTNTRFAPPDGDPFNSAFFTAPGTRTLPDGTECPPPAPQALLGEGEPLCKERFWLAADFLYAAGRGMRTPPLVTGSVAGTDPTSAGVLPLNTTRTLFGGNQLSGLRPSLRAEAGWWITPRWGVDGTFLFIPAAATRFGGTAVPGGTILAQPIINGINATEAAVPVSILVPGTIAASADTYTIGGDVNLRVNLCTSEFARWDVFAGYRFLQLRDGVRVSTDRFVPNPADGPDLRVRVTDLFRSTNEFHGPQVGLASSHRLFDRLTFSSRLGVAMGVTRSDVRVAGFTSSPLGDTSSGLLVGSTNGGRRVGYHFAVIPAADAKFGYDVTDHVRLSVGYTFVYWNRVARAADQIDRTLFAPGRPAYPAATTDYWAQGLILGIDLRY